MTPDTCLNATKNAVLTHHLVLQKPAVLTRKYATSKAQNKKQRKDMVGIMRPGRKINKKQAHSQTIMYPWDVFHINLDSPFFPALIYSTFFMTASIQG